MEREVGGGIGMGNTCKPLAVSFQCMTKSTTNKKKKKKKFIDIKVFAKLGELITNVSVAMEQLPLFTVTQDALGHGLPSSAKPVSPCPAPTAQESLPSPAGQLWN